LESNWVVFHTARPDLHRSVSGLLSNLETSPLVSVCRDLNLMFWLWVFYWPKSSCGIRNLSPVLHRLCFFSFLHLISLSHFHLSEFPVKLSFDIKCRHFLIDPGLKFCYENHKICEAFLCRNGHYITLLTIH
jgi:hypothetical protein